MTLVAVFDDSMDAHIAADRLREEFALTAQELDVIGPGDAESLTGLLGEQGPDGMRRRELLGMANFINPGAFPGEELVAKRWGDAVVEGQTLVVCRSGDPGRVEEWRGLVEETGARLVDVIDH